MYEKNLDRKDSFMKKVQLYNLMIMVGYIGYDSERISP